MSLRFEQRPMPDGIYALVIDDGSDIVHAFTECAPWCVVSEAMTLCANEYARRYWVRAGAPAC